MNKKSSSFLKNIVMVLITVTPLLFTYLFTLQGVRELNAQKNKKLEELKEKENKLEIRKDARRLNTKISTTKMLIKISNDRASSSVPRVS